MTIDLRFCWAWILGATVAGQCGATEFHVAPQGSPRGSRSTGPGFLGSSQHPLEVLEPIRGVEYLKPRLDAPAFDGWRVEEEFLAAIRGQRPVEFTDFATGVRYMEFTEAVALSAESAEAVELPLSETGYQIAETRPI